MKKQISKALMTISLALLFILAAAVTGAQAQSRINYTANIPFEFTVGNATLPAGEYNVTQIKTSDGVVMLRLSAEGQDGSALRLTDAVRADEPSRKTILVFNQYGEQYFLAQMWRAGETQGRQVRKSNRERGLESELAQNRSEQQPTRREAKAQTVEIAALAK